MKKVKIDSEAFWGSITTDFQLFLFIKRRAVSENSLFIIGVSSFILFLLVGCINFHKKGKTSILNDDAFVNIFVNKKINLDSCSVIEDLHDRTDFFIIKKDAKFGLINSSNQLILPLIYDSIERPHLSNYFFISKNNLFGIVTSDGFLTVPIYYEHIEYDWKKQKSGDEDCFIVQKNNKLGSINFHNQTIIPIEYDGISNWVEYGPDAHYVKKGDHYGIIDYDSGKLIIPVVYDGIVSREEVIEIKMKGRYGIVSWKNEEIIPCIYDRLYVDLDYFGFEKNHKDRIFAETNNVWYEFLMTGKLYKSNVSPTKINAHILKYWPDSDEYRYHLQDCMVFPTQSTNSKKE